MGSPAGWNAGGMAGWRLDRNRIPWMKGFKATRQHLSVLSEELEAFDSFAATAHQGAAAILSDVRAAVAAVCSTAEAAPGLAGALGVAVPQAPYEIDVSGLASADEVSALCCLLEADGYSVDHRPGGPGLGTLFIICGNAAAPPGCAALRLSSDDAAVKATLCAEAARSEEVRRVVQVLMHILWQSSLLGEHGVSVPVLAAMVTAMRRGLPANAPCDDAALLHATLSSYGSQFEPTQHMVTLRGARPLPPCFAPAEGGLWVCHPGDPASNLAASCRSFKRVRGLFMHCSAALRRWDGPAASAGDHSRGKSPLASVIAFNKLAIAYQKPALAPQPAQPQPPAAAIPVALPVRADPATDAERRWSAASSGGSLSSSATTDDGVGLSALAAEEDEDLPPLLLPGDDGPADCEGEPEVDLDAALSQAQGLNPLAQPFMPPASARHGTRRGSRGKGRGSRSTNTPPAAAGVPPLSAA